MLEFFYKERRTLVDFRRGPLGPHFDGFADYLKKKGYNHDCARARLGRCCLFNTFLIEKGIASCKEITPLLIESFLDVYLKDFRTTAGYDQRRFVRRDVQHLFDYLVEIGVLKPIVPKPIVTSYSWMLDPYLKYLREDGQRAEKTIQRIRGELCPFLEGLGNKVKPKRMKSLHPENIEEYIKKYIRNSSSNLKNLAGTLRGFLRFCANQGHIKQDLSGLIPPVRQYRLASLPRGMEESDLQRLLNIIEQDTPMGSRDYAIMLMMMGYGIRAKQVAELQLEDICWQRSTIRIRAQKGGKEVVVPLLEAVGEAILRYLRHRPSNSFREVFLGAKAPFGPIDGSAISRIVRRYMRKAGVKVHRGGSHTFRHSWAIRALAHDNPMKAIADVLGHRCLDTTFIYAKADLKALRQVVMPWPEVAS